MKSKLKSIFLKIVFSCFSFHDLAFEIVCLRSIRYKYNGEFVSRYAEKERLYIYIT